MLASKIVAHGVCSLETHIVEFRRVSRRLQALKGARDRILIETALHEVRRTFENLRVTYTALRRQILAFEATSTGDSAQSLRELVVRAEMFVITAHLRQITQVLHAETFGGIVDPGRACTLFTGRLQSMDDVMDFVANEFARVTATWLPHLQAHSPEVDTPDAIESRRTRYRQAVGEALRRVSAIAEHVDFAAFLHAGMSNFNRPVVQAACTQIAEILAIARRIDEELDPGHDHIGRSADEVAL
ncbi:MAG TPA: hypothetical protein VFT22_44195 [Kofleriaceae bacterium]|nr:hypothetical protein [Kofleriaceae bacterium]